MLFKKTDIQGNMLLYRRKKTGELLQVRITSPMLKIIQFFEAETLHSRYLFPIIQKPGINERKQYESALNKQNAYLEILSQLAGLEKSHYPCVTAYMGDLSETGASPYFIDQWSFRP